MKTLILFLMVATAGLQARAAASLSSVLDQYLLIQSALANDTLNGVSGAATEISKLAKEDPSGLPLALAEEASKIAKAADIAAARSAFQPLSETLIAALAADPSKAPEDEIQVFCPMAEASWIQKTGAIANPYFGKTMSSCGEARRTFGSAPPPAAAKHSMGCCGA